MVGNFSVRRAPLIMAIAALVSAFGINPAMQASAVTTFTTGDVFVSVGNGMVKWYDNDGNFIQNLDTTQGGFTTGMAFDSSGKLYVTGFSAGTISVFDTDGTLLGTFGSGGYSSPESILFDAAGDAYIGQAGAATILKLDSADSSFTVAIEDKGADWIDLASDQCTMFYTSEGSKIMKYDVCADSQLTDFVTNLHSPAFALRILPSGGLLVADSQDIHRLDSSGTTIKTYDVTDEQGWFAINLDPDGTSFWSADFQSSNFYKFDIATGNVLTGPINTGTATYTVFGLAVFGEITVSKPTYDLKLFEGSSPSDLLVNINQEATAKATVANDPDVTKVQFRWIDPSSVIQRTQDVTVAGGAAQDKFSPDEPGEWTVEADFGNGQVIKTILNIDFNVIPESILGASALMGSSLAALGGFMGLRNYRNKKKAGGYCLRCKTRRNMRDAKAVTMKNGRPAVEGTCGVCGTNMFRLGK